MKYSERINGIRSRTEDIDGELYDRGYRDARHAAAEIAAEADAEIERLRDAAIDADAMADMLCDRAEVPDGPCRHNDLCGRDWCAEIGCLADKRARARAALENQAMTFDIDAMREAVKAADRIGRWRNVDALALAPQMAAEIERLTARVAELEAQREDAELEAAAEAANREWLADQ